MATAPEYVPAAGAMAPVPYVVRERVQETADTWTLTLEPLGGREPAVAPGQFVMVYVFGVGEVPISVSGAVDRPAPLVLTVRSVGAVTRALCASEPGAVLGVRGPFGTGWPIAEAAGADVVVLAGGIGLAPLRPRPPARARAAGRLRRARAALRRAHPRRPPLSRRARALERRRVRRRDRRRRRHLRGTARSGWCRNWCRGAGFDAASAAAFVCGPEIMMRFAVQALLDRGLAAERIFVSLERNMRCGVGHCGHCQLGPTLICRDGPVYDYETAAPWLRVRAL